MLLYWWRRCCLSMALAIFFYVLYSGEVVALPPFFDFIWFFATLFFFAISFFILGLIVGTVRITFIFYDLVMADRYKFLYYGHFWFFLFLTFITVVYYI